MHLCLINPMNPLALSEIRQRWLRRYRVWKPLGVLTVAGLTPPDWDITIADENLGVRDYSAMRRPDLVGITAFTSQASRAYDLAAQFRAMGVPTVMGGIHASMCPDEAMEHVDSVVVGEAEGIWPQVLEDARAGRLQKRYRAQHAAAIPISPARHDLLPRGYGLGAVQSTRGCPLNCSFCSVTAFNGARYRHRPIDDVVAEMQSVREKFILMADDNLIGTSAAHVRRAKALFRAMIAAGLRKRWIAQVTINMGDDEELLSLAGQAGCIGVFIGFESPTPQGLAEVGKKFNMMRGRDMATAVHRIRRHGILVVGSFIIGLDTDGKGIGAQIAEAGSRYGVDLLNVLFLTPLPGTRLWKQMKQDERIVACDFPKDWRYYTLTFPVARYRQLSQAQIISEMECCDETFYSAWRIAGRVVAALRWRRGFISLVGNLSYRSSLRSNRAAYREYLSQRAASYRAASPLRAISLSGSATFHG